MAHCLCHRIDDFNRDDKIKILGIPIFLSGGKRITAENLQHRLIAAHLNTLAFVNLGYLRQKISRYISVNEQSLQSIAYPRLMGLGIIGNGHRHPHLSMLVYIGVANTIVVLDHRHAGKRHHGLNEPFTTPRNDHVQPLIHRGHHTDTFTIGKWD